MLLTAISYLDVQVDNSSSLRRASSPPEVDREYSGNAFDDYDEDSFSGSYRSSHTHDVTNATLRRQRQFDNSDDFRSRSSSTDKMATGNKMADDVRLTDRVSSITVDKLSHIRKVCVSLSDCNTGRVYSLILAVLKSRPIIACNKSSIRLALQ